MNVLHFTVALMLATTTAWADELRIAIAAEADHAEAPVSAVAARAPHILIFDAAGSMVESYKNPVAANPGGAGPALARWLAEKKVGTLVAGDFGAKLVPALEERKIAAVKASGPAARAAKELRR
jgi:predicted Fe-Mo cluster-binding NifX family protein